MLEDYIPRTPEEAVFFMARAQDHVWEDKDSWPVQSRLNAHNILWKLSLEIALSYFSNASTVSG